MSLDVTVLYVDGCPSRRTAVERVHAAADRARIRVTVSTQPIQTHHDAERLRFTGSPTILIGGVDPFARPGTVPAIACRLYSTPEGPAASPTVDQLVGALTRAAGCAKKRVVMAHGGLHAAAVRQPGTRPR